MTQNVQMFNPGPLYIKNCLICYGQIFLDATGHCD